MFAPVSGIYQSLSSWRCEIPNIDFKSQSLALILKTQPLHDTIIHIRLHWLYYCMKTLVITAGDTFVYCFRFWQMPLSNGGVRQRLWLCTIFSLPKLRGRFDTCEIICLDANWTDQWLVRFLKFINFGLKSACHLYTNGRNDSVAEHPVNELKVLLSSHYGPYLF